MASKISHLPHIKNTQAGNNYYDPQHQSIFEVYFTLPAAIQDKFKDDEAILTEQVVSVAGLDALQKTTAAGSQKFYGVDASFLQPVLDNTYADLEIVFNLNIRNATDAYVLKLFKAWGKIGYDLSDGTRTLMADYVADNLRIAEANRDGTVFRSYVFHKVMLTGITGLNELNYTNVEAAQLTVSFRADWWDEELA